MFLATLVALPEAVAQLPALQAIKGNAAAATTPPPAAETPEQTRKRLEDWTENGGTRKRQRAASPAPPYPRAFTENEVADRHSDALLVIFSAESILRSLDTATILRQASVQAKEEQCGVEKSSVPGTLFRSFFTTSCGGSPRAVATRSTDYESAVTDAGTRTRQPSGRSQENRGRSAPCHGGRTRACRASGQGCDGGGGSKPHGCG